MSKGREKREESQGVGEKKNRLLMIVAGGSALTLAFIAAVDGAWLNIDYAVGLGSPLGVIVIFAAADAGEFIIPVLAGAGRWTMKLRFAFLACVLASALCVASTLADGQGAKLTASDRDSTIYAAALADAQRVRGELSRITEDGDAATLSQIAASATARFNEEGALAARADVACSRRQRCRDADAAKTTALGRLAQAVSRDRLRGELAAAQKRVDAGPAQASGVAMGVAQLSGMDVGSVSRLLVLAFAILPLLVGKTLVWFLPTPAVRLLSTALAGSGERRVKPVKQESVKPQEPHHVVEEARVGESGPRVAHGVAHEMGQSGPPLAHQGLNVEKLVTDPTERKVAQIMAWLAHPEEDRVSARVMAKRLDLSWATFGRRRAEAVKRMEERGATEGAGSVSND